MDTGSYEYAKLKKKYGNFSKPEILVLIDGTELADEYSVLEAESELTIENDASSMMTIKVKNTANLKKSAIDYTTLSPFSLAKPVEVQMGYEDSLKTVFKGYIFERELSVSGHEAPVLTVYCLDGKAFLRMNTACETYKDVKKLSGLVEEILKKYSMSKEVTATDALAKPMTLTQFNCSDLDLICRIADETGYEFFDDMGKLLFRKPMSVGGDIITLDQDSVTKLEHKTSLRDIVSKVELYGYNADTKEAQTATATEATKKVGKGKIGAEWMDSFFAVRAASVYMTVKSSKTLENTAKSFFQKSSLNLVNLDIFTAGLPEIIPGRMIKLDDLGADINNTYYIKTVRHTQKKNTYITRITCVSNTSAR